MGKNVIKLSKDYQIIIRGAMEMEENYNNGQEQEPGNEYNYNTDYNCSYSKDYCQEDNKVLSVGEWLLTILATLVPCVGLILYFIWAFGKEGNLNRRNYCRAWLIYWVIQAVLGIILGIVLLINVMPYMTGAHM